jgi:tetratricopeptide (TPR) repeat protein
MDRAPGDPQASAMKLRICFEGQLWACAGQAMAQRYETDTAVRGDSLILKQMLATAQAVNDTSQAKDWATLSPRAKKYYQTQADKAGLLKWTEVAVQRFPKSESFWRARGGALKDAGRNDEALAAFRKAAELDPKDIPSRIAAVQLLTDQVKIDSTTPLDTAKLAVIDTLLGQVASISTDDNLRMNVAVMYFTPATKMVQSKVALEKAESFLEKTKSYDTKKQLTAQANFFEGLAYTFNLQKKFDFKALQTSKSCRELGDLNAYVTSMYGFLDGGASVQAATVNQIKTQTAGIGKFIGDAKKAWKCTF